MNKMLLSPIISLPYCHPLSYPLYPSFLPHFVSILTTVQTDTPYHFSHSFAYPILCICVAKLAYFMHPCNSSGYFGSAFSLQHTDFQYMLFLNRIYFGSSLRSY